MKKTIEFDQECSSCNGTGLYVSLAERDGAAVVCHTCKGTGCFHFKHEYTEFINRKPKKGVRRVFQSGVGIVIGENEHLKLSDFGGMPIEDWVAGIKFAPGMEDRIHVCPGRWFNGRDYDKKPSWDECPGPGCSFDRCEHYNAKSLCWARWDKEEIERSTQK